MRSLLVLLRSSLVVAVLAWAVLAACIDAPPGPRLAPARLVVGWDPLACGEPHRVAVELRDDAGAVVSASTPCSLVTLALDAAHFGSYRGRSYAWALDQPARPVAPIELTIDPPIVHWDVMVPPWGAGSPGSETGEGSAVRAGSVRGSRPRAVSARTIADSIWNRSRTARCADG